MEIIYTKLQKNSVHSKRSQESYLLIELQFSTTIIKSFFPQVSFIQIHRKFLQKSLDTHLPHYLSFGHKTLQKFTSTEVFERSSFFVFCFFFSYLHLQPHLNQGKPCVSRKSTAPNLTPTNPSPFFYKIVHHYSNFFFLLSLPTNEKRQFRRNRSIRVCHQSYNLWGGTKQVGN